MNDMHEANRRHWESLAHEWQEMRDQDQLWRKCVEQPDLVFEGAALDLIREYAGELAGKRVCLIGSGDNYAAFALAGMGAVVTSTDISEQQLCVAAKRAEILGLRIQFVQVDAADLGSAVPAEFDLVCSTNGFFVWLADVARVFAAAHGVLKPGGYYIGYEMHPLQRPWKNKVSVLEMAKPYFDTGPFRYQEQGETAYNFHWTLADIINPLLASGLLLRRMLERPAKDSRFWQGSSYVPGTDDSLLNWRDNPRAGLPVWLALAAQKPGNRFLAE